MRLRAQLGFALIPLHVLNSVFSNKSAAIYRFHLICKHISPNLGLLCYICNYAVEDVFANQFEKYSYG